MINSKIYRNFNEVYQRIIKNKPFDIKLKPYSEDFLKTVIIFFEKEEEYEKCKLINDYIKERFNHNSNFIKK